MLRRFFRSLLEVDGSIDQSLRRPPSLYPQDDETSGLVSKVVEIVLFGDLTLANDQDPSLHFPKWAPSPQAIVSSRH